jgi:predicted nicotinamide N-methyase
MAALKAQGVVLGRPQTLPESVRARIVSEFAAGESLSGIARALAADNVPTAQGGQWHASTIRKILRTA